jgi:hypothetical protein
VNSDIRHLASPAKTLYELEGVLAIPALLGIKFVAQHVKSIQEFGRQLRELAQVSVRVRVRVSIGLVLGLGLGLGCHDYYNIIIIIIIVVITIVFIIIYVVIIVVIIIAVVIKALVISVSKGETMSSIVFIIYNMLIFGPLTLIPTLTKSSDCFSLRIL